ncbi:MAG TPA: RNA polymerase sigma factor [Candidatus Acidoferrales bacterium]|nr:RNA polymerase sigma factor [Candidatus Acidoferrales bacterium]HTS61003.1 RNA polymerase sigma factor [Candidatus Acidoferrales bacterium]
MTAAATLQIESWPQTISEFERLVEATQDELVQFAFYRLGNRADAEDAVQDVYVQAFRDRDKRRHITEVRPYLFRMVRNRCTDVLRGRSRKPAGQGQEAGAGDTLADMLAREEAGEFARLLDRIPEREAEVIRLRAWSELSFAEVAVAVGAAVPTVKSRFRYGIEKLRRLLNLEGGMPR